VQSAYLQSTSAKVTELWHASSSENYGVFLKKKQQEEEDRNLSE
jgi:hypothetical protein